MVLSMKKHWKKIAQYTVDVTFWLCMLATAWFATQVLLFASFKIPSDSMEPELTTGDNILVWKPTIGPRIFNLFASMRNEQTEIYRIPGFKNINGKQPPLGNTDSQKKIAVTEKFQEGIFHSFPYDGTIGWNIKEFGPLHIPAKGDSIRMNRTNFVLYKKLIEWEQQGTLEYKDSTSFLNGKPIDGYRFLKNYYFMAGDNGMNSQDSRYWGMLPEEYIVGKAWLSGNRSIRIRRNSGGNDS